RVEMLGDDVSAHFIINIVGLIDPGDKESAIGQRNRRRERLDTGGVAGIDCEGLRPKYDGIGHLRTSRFGCAPRARKPTLSFAGRPRRKSGRWRVNWPKTWNISR